MWESERAERENIRNSTQIREGTEGQPVDERTHEMKSAMLRLILPLRREKQLPSSSSLGLYNVRGVPHADDY